MKKLGRRLILILVFGLGANVGCRSRSAQKGSAPESVLGSLDAPTRGSTLRETAIVGGWAVAQSGVKRVGIYIDRQLIRFEKTGGKRPDVGQIYGQAFPGADLAGWTFVLDVSKMADGDHQMVAKVESNRGAVHELEPVPFQVIH
jgi:Bacterial Ig domain